MNVFRPARCCGSLVAFAIALLIGLLGIDGSSASETVSIAGQTMGTTYSVKLPVEYSDQLDMLQELIQVRLTEIDARMSTYKEGSEVSQFNRAPAKEWFPVSPDTAEVVRRSLEISEQTDGAFDITVGPLVRLWNFGAGSRSTFSIPSMDEIDEAKDRIGYLNVEVRLDPPALRKAINRLEIDLSGIAKGFAVDQVGSVLQSKNITDYLIEIGGEIRTSGQRARGVEKGGNPWVVGIESPQASSRIVAQTIALTDASMATSGDYRNFFEIEGVRYSHTIDPRTGRPVRHSIASATVVGPDCATADALATSLLVMGDDARTFAEHSDLAALFFEGVDGTDEFSVYRTSSFPSELLSDASDTTSSPASFWRLLAASIIVMGIAIIAMAIGVIFSNRCIKGSCGGMAGLADEHGRPLCEGCSTPSEECTADPNIRQHAVAENSDASGD